jgi:hypothetical protein
MGDPVGQATDIGRYLQHLIKAKLASGLALKDLSTATRISSPQLSEIRDQATGVGNTSIARWAKYEGVEDYELMRRAKEWAGENPLPMLERRREEFRAILLLVAERRADRFTADDVSEALGAAMKASVEMLSPQLAERLMERVAETRELLAPIPVLLAAKEGVAALGVEGRQRVEQSLGAKGADIGNNKPSSVEEVVAARKTRPKR